MINSTQLPFIVGISVLTTTSLLYYLYRKTRNNYVKVCNVKKLFIYPIKAVKGVQVNQLEITKYGVKYGSFTDRSWILLDNANNVIGMKSFPKLVLTRTRILGQEVWVDGPDMPTLKLRYIDEINDSHNIISINLYGQRIKGIDCGPEVNQWFETFLSRPGVRLLQHHHSFDFRDSDTYKRRKDDKDYPIIYQNKSGLHLINESSISDLNSRFPEGEDHAIDENFRPNLVVEYREPWAEDKWKWMRINGVTFIRLIACDRCLNTSVNQKTGDKVKTLETLQKFRPPKPGFNNKSPTFGNIYGHLSNGFINVSDSVEIVYGKNEIN